VPVTLDAAAVGPLRIAVTPTAALSGTVRMDGKPIAAMVTAQPSSSPLALSLVVAGADGGFHYDQLAPGSYSVAAAVGDPLEGAPLTPVGVDIVAGGATHVDLEAFRGNRALDVTSAKPGVVFVTTETIAASTAVELVTTLGRQTRGHWAMRPSSGNAHFASLGPVAYTVCALALEAGPDAAAGLQTLTTRNANAPTICSPVSATANAITLH
jgi:hypothetical protein